MLLLFYALSEVAESFLVPAVEVSFHMSLTQSLYDALLSMPFLCWHEQGRTLLGCSMQTIHLDN